MTAPAPPKLPPAPPVVRRRRRGGPAIEFALVLPVFMLIVGVIFEYSWYFFMRSTVMSAATTGCRAGAVVPPDEDPTDVAENQVGQTMNTYSFFGMDCSDPEDENCTIAVSTSGDSPSEVITCAVAVVYPGLTGIVPVPSAISFSTSRIFEVQR